MEMSSPFSITCEVTNHVYTIGEINDIMLLTQKEITKVLEKAPAFLFDLSHFGAVLFRNPLLLPPFPPTFLVCKI